MCRWWRRKRHRAKMVIVDVQVVEKKKAPLDA